MIASIEMIEGIAADRGAEAARLRPLGATCVTVDWPLPPGDGDETIRPDVVAALSRALAACGSVAFHHDDGIAGASGYVPPVKRSVKDRLLDIAGLGDDAFGLVVATDPISVAALFAYGGWSFAAQAALVFEPHSDPAPIFAALREGPDWRGRTLPPAARILFGPGHDGDFAVVAAPDAIWLERFKTHLQSA